MCSRFVFSELRISALEDRKPRPQELPVVVVGHPSLQADVQLRGDLVGRLFFGDVQPRADNFGERPVGDSVAVRQTATGVPEHRVGEPVDVLEQLPAQARLPWGELSSMTASGGSG